MRIFVSGPMTGLPDWNRPAFSAAAAFWRSHGHEVVSPAEFFGGDTTLPHSAYLRRSVMALAGCACLDGCDTICMLDGWERSEGARLEHSVALACGIAVLYLRPLGVNADTTGNKPEPYSRIVPITGQAAPQLPCPEIETAEDGAPTPFPAAIPDQSPCGAIGCHAPRWRHPDGGAPLVGPPTETHNWQPRG